MTDIIPHCGQVGHLIQHSSVIGDGDDCHDDINIKVNELNTCAPFLLGNKGAHVSNGNVASFWVGEKGI